jgi:ribosomal protein S18 acetylase RimI-like enzyme
MASTQVTIVPRHDFSVEEIDQIEDWLYEYNTRVVGQRDGRKLGFAAVDRHGAQVGAIAGYSWARMAEIKQLWVAETHRGKGLGRSLLETAVVEAGARDCRLVWVMTYDFQAPGLYERCGFERVAELLDWPPGHTHIILRLHLDAR